MNDTLNTYQEHADTYAAATGTEMPADLSEWLTRSVDGLDPEDATIFEIGSGHGRDADWLTDAGYAVQTSDAVPAFVDMLTAKGYDAIAHNVVTDPLPPSNERTGAGWDLVLADAVLLHLPFMDFRAALWRIRFGLVPGGRVAFTVKEGKGEEWSDAKLGAPRFFRYWDKRALREELFYAGYRNVDITTHPGWLHVVARLP